MQAYEGVCSSFRSDYSTHFKLSLPWSAVPSHLGLLSLSGPDNCLQLYSSNSSLSFKQEVILLDSDRRDSGCYEIWCEVLGTDNSLKTFEVTCVASEDAELLYGWTITVYPYLPRIWYHISTIRRYNHSKILFLGLGMDSLGRLVRT